MTIGELIAIFQTYAGQTWYYHVDQASQLNVIIIILNFFITFLVFVLFKLIFSAIKGIIKYWPNDYEYKPLEYSDGNYENRSRQEIEAAGTTDKYEKVQFSNYRTVYIWRLILLLGILYFAIGQRHNEHHAAVSYYPDKMVLRNNAVYVQSIFHNDTVYYKDIYNISVTGEAIYIGRNSNNLVGICTMYIQTKNGKVVSFSMLDNNVKKFNMDTCF